MNRSALALAVIPLLAAAAVANDPAIETLADLEQAPPVWVYQQLTAQPSAPANAPRTLDEVQRRTGHSRVAMLRLLKIQARDSQAEPLSLPWVNDTLVGAARAKASGRAAAHARSTLRPGAVRYDQLPEGVSLRLAYRRGQLEIVASRTVADAPLAIAIPPGTVARAVGAGAQDLALLESAVIELAAGRTQARVEIFTTCASYGYANPSRARGFALEPCEAGTPLDLLLKRVCLGPIADAPSQLAVWIASGDVASVRWSATMTFRGARVGPEHVREAAELLLESGVDPRGLNLFGGEDEAPSGATP